MFAVLFGTGCRIGEASGLKWKGLDYDRRTIIINHRWILGNSVEGIVI